MSRKTPPSTISSPGCAPEAELSLLLRPHPWVPLLAACGMGLLLLLVIMVFREGRFALAAGGAAAAAGLASALWREWEGGMRPCALLLGPEGRLALRFADGSRVPVELARGSVFIGRGALLVLRGAGHHRLWLGRSNLAPAELAALRRWLSRAGASLGHPERNFLY